MRRALEWVVVLAGGGPVEYATREHLVRDIQRDAFRAGAEAIRDECRRQLEFFAKITKTAPEVAEVVSGVDVESLEQEAFEDA